MMLRKGCTYSEILIWEGLIGWFWNLASEGKAWEDQEKAPRNPSLAGFDGLK